METRLKKSKAPIIIIDKSLNELKGKEFFPEKLKKVNDILAKSGLPDIKKLK
ncbi:hypothetical protein [Dyadobacter chenhuakuii]|uniref:Uncharacterized protein n=1 Tax=Dyadobacter chenhuakuii TaxID=2909339 RepID=A0A9X1QEQ6_9BACT|nr:hypothetical protein [Dyadobacter chenhuakuii]MCF2500325.1 hypothetical protein [Dyadobacter chenhuakuii]